MSPLPSEFIEKVNSLSRVGERTLFKLIAAVRFGRDQPHCARSKLPTNGSLKCHGICVPRSVSRWFGVSITSSLSVSLRRSDHVDCVPIQFDVPCWKPGVGRG